MSQDSEKTPFDQLKDVLNQIKEMRHYSKANVEKLTGYWMSFDGELKEFKLAQQMEDMMTRQGGFYDALESTILDMEATINRIEQAQSSES